ncbi:MAG: zf-HC2 domain-containing protein [Oligoflexia bacterium]|nr:zf-HC2 domain-containing protein [Oligoflexia bacterium]
MSLKRMNKKRYTTPCGIDEELWLDFSEGELDPSLSQELEAHLAGCGDCQKAKEGWSRLGSLLRSDKLEMPHDLYFKKLENQIMSKVSTTQIEPLHPEFAFQARQYLVPVAAVFVLIMSSVFVGLHRSPVPSEKSVPGLTLDERYMAETVAGDPSVLNEVLISNQDEHEMLLDVATRRLDLMNGKKSEETIEQMR